MQAELKIRIAVFNEKAVAAVFCEGATDEEENRKRKAAVSKIAERF